MKFITYYVTRKFNVSVFYDPQNNKFLYFVTNCVERSRSRIHCNYHSGKDMMYVLIVTDKQLPAEWVTKATVWAYKREIRDADVYEKIAKVQWYSNKEPHNYLDYAVPNLGKQFIELSGMPLEKLAVLMEAYKNLDVYERLIRSLEDAVAIVALPDGFKLVSISTPNTVYPDKDVFVILQKWWLDY